MKYSGQQPKKTTYKREVHPTLHGSDFVLAKWGLDATIFGSPWVLYARNRLE